METHKVYYRGHILPSPILIDVPETQAHWDEGDGFPGGVIRCTIEKSKVKVEAEVNGPPTDDNNALFIRAFDIAQAMVNVVAFKQAVGLSVHITDHSRDGELWSPLAFNNPVLNPLVTSFTLSEKFEEVVIHSAASNRIRHALNDLILAISVPHESVTACARSVEAIKHEISDEGLPSGQAWAQMHSALRLSSSYLKLVTEQSKLPRHGNHVRVDGAITTEITKRAWVTMDRYLHFVLGGKAPLDPVQFPVLEE